MIVIRPEQLRVLNDVARRARLQERLPMLRLRHGVALAALSDEAVIELVLRVEAKAARYELHRDSDRLAYLGLALRFGEAMDEDPARPWIGAILRDPLLDGPARLRRMAEEVELRGRRGAL
jgi:hypothetical protein